MQFLLPAREPIQEELRAAPFVAFRWETPPLTSTNINQPFECLLHDSPGLDVRADPTDFKAYFLPGVEVVKFQNLGADALLIVPYPVSKSANYSHIGAFHRSAPYAQQHAFWIAVAQTVLARIGLVKTMTLAVDFEAGDKLNEAGIVIRPTCFRGTYAESKPTLPTVQAHLTRACIRVPGGQQIGLVAERKTTVARAHQLFSCLRELTAI